MIKENRSVNIKDVARKAGVSPSTVSRVMNNPQIVRQDTREKVQQAINELNFIPDPMARGLGSRSIRTIAIVVPNITNSCMAEIVKGAVEVFRNHHIDTLLFNSDEDPEMERRHYQYLTENMIHGVIFITNCGADVDFGRIAGSMPVVLVDREESHPRVDTFIVDDRQGVRTLYYHLRSLGHKRIGMLGGNGSTRSSQRRVKAFRELLEEEGYPFSDDLVAYSPWTMDGGRDAFVQLLEARPDLTAVICNSDMLAMAAMGVAYKREMKVPEDIAVVGFDNFPEGAHMAPSLTTLAYPHREIGRKSALAVISRFGDMNKPERYELLPLELEIRRSSRPNVSIQNG